MTSTATSDAPRTPRGVRGEARRLVRLALPVFVSQIALVVMVLADTAMAGSVGTEDLAGVGVAQGFSVAAFVAQIGFFSGLTPVLSRLSGERKPERIPNAIYQSLGTAVAWSIINVTFLAVVSPILVAGLVHDAHVLAVATTYLRLLAWGVPAHILYLVMRNVMEALQETVLSMKLSFLGLLVKVPLNALFIYGLGGREHGLGGPGCGLASAVTYVAMAIGSVVLARRALLLHGIRWRREDCVFSPDVLRELLRLGVPLAAAILSETALFSVTSLLIAPHGARFIAGHEIAYSLATPAYLVSMSVGTAVTIRVSERLGQSDPAGAAETTRAGLVLGLGLAVVTACATAFGRARAGAFFSSDPSVLALTNQLLVFCAIYQLPDAVQNILGASLRGYRESGILLKGALCAHWLVGFPAGFVLANYGLGFFPPAFPHGYWVGFLVALSATGVIYGVRLLAVEREHGSQRTLPLAITALTSSTTEELPS